MNCCPNCNNPVDDGVRFCPKCGTRISTDVHLDVTPTKPPETVKSKNKDKSGKKLPLIIAIIAVAVMAVAAAAVLLIPHGSSSKAVDNNVIFLKDGELYYYNVKEKVKGELTSEFDDDDDDARYLAMYDNTYKISNDGKSIVYIDKVDSDDGTASLYYKNLSDTESEPIKIDSEINVDIDNIFAVSDDFEYVTYTKNYNLYQYCVSTDSKDKICIDVDEVYVHTDGEIVYLDDDYQLRYYSPEHNSVKISSDCDDFRCTSDTVFYIKNDCLYKCELSTDPESVKIASGATNIVTAYDSGEVYFEDRTDIEKPYIDYIDNDLEELEAVEKPEYPEYPDLDIPDPDDYENDDDFDTAWENYLIEKEEAWDEYDDAVDEYYDLMDEYEDYLDADEIISDIFDELIDNTFCAIQTKLYYYDGSKTQTVSEDLWNIYAVSKNSPYIIYKECGEVPQISLYDVLDNCSYVDDVTYELYSRIWEYLMDGEMFTACGKNVTAVNLDDVSDAYISDDETTAVFLADFSEIEHNDYYSYEGTLYTADLSKNGMQKPAKYDSDVMSSSIKFNSKGQMIYFKNYDGEYADLYVNKEKVDTDVYPYYSKYLSSEDALFYYTAYNYEKGIGTLKKYTEKETIKIADDVHDWCVSGNKILYVGDYSAKHDAGDLYIFANSEAEKIDEDVTCLAVPYGQGNLAYGDEWTYLY